MTTLERMMNEKTKWELSCPNEDYRISIEDIQVIRHGRRAPIELKDAREVLKNWRDNDLLYTYLDLTPSAVSKILSAKDDFFKLEKIAIICNKRVELFFTRKNSFNVSSIILDLEKRPSFTAILAHQSGDIVQKTRVSVDVDRNVNIETFW